jgi:UDP-glucose 4-epimerase
MSILLTGYQGYIGSHIYDYLLSNRYTVYGLDINKFDIGNYNKLDNYVFNKQIKTIIHLASYKNILESQSNPLIYYENNIIILINILKVMSKYNIKHLIFSSSASILNNNKLVELHNLSNPYAKTKLICEEIIKDTCKINNINYTILRYFNPHGFTINKDIIPFIKKNSNIYFQVQKHLLDTQKPFIIYGNNYNTRDGTCIRDYIHIDILVKKHIKYINNCNNKIKNIGTGNGMTVLEFIKMYNVKNYKYESKREGDIEISINKKVHILEKFKNIKNVFKIKNKLKYVLFFNTIIIFFSKIYFYIKNV